MKCCIGSCQEPAVIHITEVINDIPEECHTCQIHAEQYFGGVEEFKKQYWEHVHKHQHKHEPKPIAISELVAWISGCFGILSEKKAEEVIQPLIDQLNVEAPSIRLTAALVLGEVGRGRSEVIAALQKALVDSNEQVREAACWALEKQQRASHRIL